MNKIPVSRIKNATELSREIKLVKLRIKVHELDLKDRWKRLPEESVKATLGAVIPFFLRQKVASGTWTLVKTVAGLFFSKSKPDISGSWKDILLGNAKKWGLLAAAQGIFKAIKNRKQ